MESDLEADFLTDLVDDCLHYEKQLEAAKRATDTKPT